MNTFKKMFPGTTWIKAGRKLQHTSDEKTVDLYTVYITLKVDKILTQIMP
jgi:hypothetical protein